jgi:mono/diheme cytochrome c family protein
MKRGTILSVILALVFIAALGFSAGIVRGGLSTRTEPSRVETIAARWVRSLSVPGDAKTLANPWAGKGSAEVLDAAKAHWADHCASCHANDGSGNTEMGRTLYPRAPDMRLAATQNLTDGELYYIIRNGVRLTGMPAWGSAALKQDDESWQLVLFIRRLPTMSMEEAEAMKALNPRTDADRDEELEEQKFLNGGEEQTNSPSEAHHHSH